MEKLQVTPDVGANGLANIRQGSSRGGRRRHDGGGDGGGVNGSLLVQQPKASGRPKAES